MLAAGAIGLLAIGGLTDSMPSAEMESPLDWVPAIDLASPVPKVDLGPIVTRHLRREGSVGPAGCRRSGGAR